MDKEKLVINFINISEQISKQFPLLNLLALLQREDQETWDLLVGSDEFINQEKESLGKIVKILRDNLSGDELKDVSRAVLLKKDNVIVRNINKTFNVKSGSPVLLQDSSINNLLFKKMYVFYSSK